ncbi:Flp family type IVb pilin [Nocardioides sediminis]|uniref:Flp family type IVb pilin n=1 Tax=Nocardioides sediminis TaxID=433648 RepID=UPI0019010E5D|nr:hypothetical protein [Nocardioides sediminis]
MIRDHQGPASRSAAPAFAFYFNDGDETSMRASREEAGATSTEYAIMCTMIAGFIAGSVAIFGNEVAALFAPAMAGL